MKKIIYLLLLSIFFGCTAENDLIDLSSAEAPSKLDALFKIKQDNSGFVTITPTGEGVTQYEIFHGDTANLSVKIKPGESTTHTYTEGVYPVKIVGMGVNGVKTEMIKQLTVSFLQPTNLVVTVNPLLGNNLGIKVSATANLETYFQVFFGENPNQVPVNFNEGDIIQHIYGTVGTYQLRVRALSGGAAFAENIQTITISDPVLLPVNFESPTTTTSE